MNIRSSNAYNAVTQFSRQAQNNFGSVLNRISKVFTKSPKIVDETFQQHNPIRSNRIISNFLVNVGAHIENPSPRLSAEASVQTSTPMIDSEPQPQIATPLPSSTNPHLSTFGSDSNNSLKGQLSNATGYAHLKPSMGGGKTPITGMVGVYDLKNTGVVFKRDTASAILSAQRFANLADAFEIPNARLEVIDKSPDLLKLLPDNSKLKGLKKELQNLINNHPDKSHVRGQGEIEIKCLLIQKIEGEDVLSKRSNKEFYSQASIQQQLGKIFVFDKMVGCEDRFPNNPSNLILTSDNKLVCIDSSTSFNLNEDISGSELNLQLLAQQSSRMNNGNFLTETLKNFSNCVGLDASVFIQSVHDTVDNFMMHLEAGKFNAAFAKTDHQNIPEFDIEMMRDMSSILKSNR